MNEEARASVNGSSGGAISAASRRKHQPEASKAGTSPATPAASSQRKDRRECASCRIPIPKQPELLCRKCRTYIDLHQALQGLSGSTADGEGVSLGGAAK